METGVRQTAAYPTPPTPNNATDRHCCSWDVTCSSISVRPTKPSSLRNGTKNSGPSLAGRFDGVGKSGSVNQICMRIIHVA